jgi:hypothetical protein
MARPRSAFDGADADAALRTLGVLSPAASQLVPWSSDGLPWCASDDDGDDGFGELALMLAATPAQVRPCSSCYA